MSYTRRLMRRAVRSPRALRGLSGVQSQPAGGRVFRSAISGLGADHGPAWYRQMQGCSLGDDASSSATSLTERPTVDDAVFRTEALSTLQAMRAQDADRIHKEEVRGYLQLAATLSIPLAAFLWRRILGRGKAAT